MTDDPPRPQDRSQYGPVLRFLGKAVAVYAVWYIVYDLWLLPDGHLDEWVSHSVVWVAQGALGIVGFDPTADGRALRGAGRANCRRV